uniref:NADH dehydrogenase subunit 3 n=1 Tax=Cirroctopus glacialis TaxID=202433 RepID=UPI0022FD6A03|nr:NADH dehydrogenase subunit 3 [Cirroctopus glacialis]WAP91397.1 NADH dehydrogenase subunit 3 [Cirroctopus glacialis]
MMTIVIMSIILFILISILVWISIIIMFSSYNDREKSSPFECGFDPSSHTRSPFSMRFFLLAVIFLIFDIEIILLIPIISNMINSPSFTHVSSTMTFLLILLIGLIHEWNQGSLNWL